MKICMDYLNKVLKIVLSVIVGIMVIVCCWQIILAGRMCYFCASLPVENTKNTKNKLFSKNYLHPAKLYAIITWD